ncbi:MAG: thiamine-phosphate kinase [Steroidobacteraceae bacterium]
MALGEFELIERFFAPLGRDGGDGVLAGIGDDAAVLAVPPGTMLVAALDTLVEGRHFLPGSPAASVGHRALAVNLSDLAAMGADPGWYLLSLTLPQVDERWLAGFASGLRQLARDSGIALVGGDTTRGPLAVSVQVLGFARPGEALLRSGARPGDLLFVSGSPGEAAAGLAIELAADAGRAAPADPAARQLLRRLHFPMPRLALGRALRGLASACIDVSDGLAADALRLAQASGCGLRIEAADLPLSAALRAISGEEAALVHALSGGDDYELCFTVPAERLAELAPRLAAGGCAATCVGVVEAEPGLRVLRNGRPHALARTGFDHFSPGSDPRGASQ